MASNIDAMTRELLKKIVERQGYKTREAESGEKTPEIFHPARMGLVISDLEMSEINGLELLKAIKKKLENSRADNHRQEL